MSLCPILSGSYTRIGHRKSRRVLFLSPGTEMAIVSEIGRGAYWVMGFLGGLKDLADFIDAEIFFSLLISLKSECSCNFVKFGQCFMFSIFKHH